MNEDGNEQSTDWTETINFDSFNKLLLRIINKHYIGAKIDDHILLLNQIYFRITIRKVIKKNDGQIIMCYPKIKVQIQNEQSNNHESHNKSLCNQKEPCNNQEQQKDSQFISDETKWDQLNRKIKQRIDLDSSTTFPAFIQKEDMIYEEHVIYNANNEDYKPTSNDIVVHILADLNDVMPLGYPTDQFLAFFKNNFNNSFLMSENQKQSNKIISEDLNFGKNKRIKETYKVQKDIFLSKDKENFHRCDSEIKTSSVKLYQKKLENSILQELNYQDMENKKKNIHKQTSDFQQEIENKSFSSIIQNSQRASSDLLNDLNQNLQFPNDSYFMKDLQTNKFEAQNHDSSSNKNQMDNFKDRNRLSDLNLHSKEESFQYNYSDKLYFNSNKSAASFESIISTNQIKDINCEKKTEFLVYLKQQVQLEIQKEAQYLKMKIELEQLSANFKIAKDFQQTELDKKKLKEWILNEKKNSIQEEHSNEIQQKQEMIKNFEEINDQIQKKQQMNDLLEKNIKQQNYENEKAKQIYEQILQNQQQQLKENQLLNKKMENEKQQFFEFQQEQQFVEQQSVQLQNQIDKILHTENKYHNKISDKNQAIQQAKNKIHKINQEIEEFLNEEYEIQEEKDMLQTQISFLNKQKIILQRESENMIKRIQFYTIQCQSALNDNDIQRQFILESKHLIKQYENNIKLQQIENEQFCQQNLKIKKELKKQKEQLIFLNIHQQQRNINNQNKSQTQLYSFSRCKSAVQDEKIQINFVLNNSKSTRNNSQINQYGSFRQYNQDLLETKNKTIRFPADSLSEFDNRLRIDNFHNTMIVQNSKLHEKSQLQISGGTRNFQQNNIEIIKKNCDKNYKLYQNQIKNKNKYLDQLDKSIAQNLLKIDQLKQGNQGNKELKNRNLKLFLSKQNIADQNKQSNFQSFAKKINTRNQQYDMIKHEQQQMIYEQKFSGQENQQIINLQNYNCKSKNCDYLNNSLKIQLLTQKYKSSTPQPYRPSQQSKYLVFTNNYQKNIDNYDFELKIQSKFGNQFFKSQKNENEKRYKSQQPIKNYINNQCEYINMNEKMNLQQYESKKDSIINYNQNDQVITQNYYTFANEVKDQTAKLSSESLKKYKNSNIRNTSEFKNFKYNTEDMKYANTQKISKSLNQNDEKIQKKESKIPILQKYILNQVDSSTNNRCNQNYINQNYKSRIIHLKEQCINPLKSISNNYNSIENQDFNSNFNQDKISQYQIKDSLQLKNEPTIKLINENIQIQIQQKGKQEQQNHLINQDKYQNINDYKSLAQIKKQDDFQYQRIQYENFPLSKLGVNFVSNFAKKKMLLETNLNEKEKLLHSSQSLKIINNENLISFPQSQFNFSNMSTKEINPVTSKSVSNVSDNQSIMKIEHKIDNEYVEIQNLDTKKFLNQNQISQSIDFNKQRSDELQRMPESKIESILQNEEYKNENYSEYRDSLIMNQKFQQNNFDQAKLFEQFKQLTCLPQDSTPSSIVEKSTQSNKYLAPITEKFDDYSTNQIQGREQNTLENIQQELTQLLQPQNHGNYNSQNVKKKQTDNFEFLQQQISKIDNQQYLIYTQQRVHKNKKTESDNKENEKIEEKAGEMLLAGSNEQTNEKTMGNENIQLNLQTEPQILVNEYQSYQDQYADEENVSDGENENDKTYLSLKEQADIISMPRSAKGPSYLYN